MKKDRITMTAGEVGVLMKKLTNSFLKRFDHLEARFDKLETRFDKLETRFDKLETRFDKLESDVGEIKFKLGNLESEVNKIKFKLDDLDGKVDMMKTNQTSMFLSLETEVKGILKNQDSRMTHIKAVIAK